ncbi:glycosyltransferase [Subsaxibacter sp. CAU 1640]|uniref:glycosyltransferase n=1 Tax=Subsaxibacter sp. CAU 1640 TaxID=2933271 RepID=UPI0020050D0C|nr:glycosyltransferase [Subsaxibacter sp. CAU 1640]MCK7589884.1 glycosyltransferase [Subsaxibacter sp. CAU 1640]
MRSLTIISHTEHYLAKDQTIVGLSSTVTEINHLMEIFDRVVHIAMLHKCEPPPNTLPYISDAIQFVALPALGGKGVKDKFSILLNAPKVLTIIRKYIKTSDYFQFRAPTGIGVYVIPYLIFLTSKKGWFKYAGNWKQKNAPISYRFQKWMLERQIRAVTINGFWADQPKQCLSFENPCLTQQEIIKGQSIRKLKTLSAPINFCFVGRLEEAKGVGLILDAFAGLDNSIKNKIGCVHFIGDGENKEFYQNKSSSIDLNFIFHGYLPRQKVHELYKQCHSILLPSRSEGFPKVIAEAMNYGCIPIVSNVSSLGHYIKEDDNGYLLSTISEDDLRQCLYKLLNLNGQQFRRLINSNDVILRSFTYSHYNMRLLNEIL